MKKLACLAVVLLFCAVLTAQSRVIISVNASGSGYFVDSGGNRIQTNHYDRVGVFREGLARVERNGLVGFVDCDGNEVVALMYDDASYSFSYGLASVKYHGKWGFVDRTGKLVIPCRYDKNSYFSKDGIAVMSINKRQGAIDRTGKVIVPFQYDYVYQLGNFLRVTKNDKEGYYDVSGRQIAPCVYLDDYHFVPNSYFHDGLCPLNKDGRYGYINERGHLVTPFTYESTDYLSDGFGRVKKHGKVGFVNTSGKLAIPCIYEDACDFYDGIAAVRLEGKWGFINHDGELVIPCVYDNVVGFVSGLCRVSSNGKYGFIGRDGNIIIPVIYRGASYWFLDGLVSMRSGLKWALFNVDGVQLSEFAFDQISESFDVLSTKRFNIMSNYDIEDFFSYPYDLAYEKNLKMLVVSQNNKYGYINSYGEIVVPCRYDSASHFSEGLGRVTLGGKVGYVDMTGKLVIPFKSEDDETACGEDSYFYCGLNYFCLHGKWGVIDRSGTVIVDPVADDLSSLRWSSVDR